MYLIKKVSEISGVSVRTLHHYDEIGLLSPRKNENGYRYYTEEDLSYLQTILFYKYLGFTLKEIKNLLKHEESEILPHLKKQLILMKKEKQRILTLINTLEKTIESQERRITMPTKDKFTGLTFLNDEKYSKIAIDMYGKDIIEDAIEHQKGKEQEMTAGFNEIFFAFANNKSLNIESTSSENTALAKKLHEHLCKYSFDCPLDTFKDIGYGYVENEDFKDKIDQFGEGTAQYVCEAIVQYVKDN